MRFWTAHLHANAAPVLIPEAFSVGAFLFGPFWLALHRAWLPAWLGLAAAFLILLLAPAPLGWVLEFALALLLGLSGQDLRRWSMDRRGYLLGHVLAARTESEALGRLLGIRPDLMGRYLPAVSER